MAIHFDQKFNAVSNKNSLKYIFKQTKNLDSDNNMENKKTFLNNPDSIQNPKKIVKMNQKYYSTSCTTEFQKNCVDLILFTYKLFHKNIFVFSQMNNFDNQILNKSI